jgi:uncharacterized protein (DUF302 family)
VSRVRRWRPLLAAGLLLLGGAVTAQSTLMARTDMKFERAIGVLQQTLEEYGYKVAHVQRCDGGMADFGYKSDFYRVVFFGKVEEVRRLSRKHPELVPYLPLKILLFAEKDETVLVVLNPLDLARRFEAEELKVQFQRWHSDIRAILDEVRRLP